MSSYTTPSPKGYITYQSKEKSKHRALFLVDMEVALDGGGGGGGGGADDWRAQISGGIRRPYISSM